MEDKIQIQAQFTGKLLNRILRLLLTDRHCPQTVSPQQYRRIMQVDRVQMYSSVMHSLVFYRLIYTGRHRSGSRSEIYTSGHKRSLNSGHMQ